MIEHETKRHKYRKGWPIWLAWILKAVRQPVSQIHFNLLYLGACLAYSVLIVS